MGALRHGRKASRRVWEDLGRWSRRVGGDLSGWVKRWFMRREDLWKQRIERWHMRARPRGGWGGEQEEEEEEEEEEWFI